MNTEGREVFKEELMVYGGNWGGEQELMIPTC